jgi:hypothetical protein
MIVMKDDTTSAMVYGDNLLSYEIADHGGKRENTS